MYSQHPVINKWILRKGLNSVRSHPPLYEVMSHLYFLVYFIFFHATFSFQICQCQMKQILYLGKPSNIYPTLCNWDITKWYFSGLRIFKRKKIRWLGHLTHFFRPPSTLLDKFPNVISHFILKASINKIIKFYQWPDTLIEACKKWKAILK